MANYQTNETSQQSIYGKLKTRVFITPFRKAQPLQQTTYNNPYNSYGPSSKPFISNSAPQKTGKKAGASYDKKLLKVLTRRHKSAAKVELKVYNNHNDDQVSEYINRVKGGMRSDSDIGIETVPTKTKEVSRRDSLNDKVSNFLSHARIKFRTTSSIGDMKSISNKGKWNNYK